MKKHFITAAIAAAALGLDIFTKILVEKHLMITEKVNVIGTFVQFTLVYNEGGVFGILQGYKKFFLIVSLFVLVALVLFYVYEKHKDTLFIIAMGLIFGGACGNIMDRIMSKPGVVDFIYIGVDKVYKWPAFNVADSCIVVGAILLVIIFIRQEMKTRREK